MSSGPTQPEEKRARKQLLLRLTPQQIAQLRARAKDCGLTMSDYVWCTEHGRMSELAALRKVAAAAREYTRYSVLDSRHRRAGDALESALLEWERVRPTTSPPPSASGEDEHQHAEPHEADEHPAEEPTE